ncbi:MAG: oxidoreductase [Candidatus Levyibacteriota bacterium]
MKIVDSFLNQFTMYRLTLYFLIGLLFYALVLSFLSFLPYKPLDILISIALTVLFSYLSNIIFAKMFKATTNVESVFITALILNLIITPKLPLNSGFLILVSVFAMAVKYFPTIEKRHIFNPAAAAVAAFPLWFPDHSATWWVGTPAMFIPTLIGGYLLVRKIRRERLVYTFLGAYISLVAGFSIVNSGSFSVLYNTLKIIFLQSPLIFFSCVMLTEPLTSPATKKIRSWYSILVAFLYASPQIRLFSFALTPEWALVGGNIFTYFASPNFRLGLQLLKKVQLTADTVLFTFAPVEQLRFIPGQYMEWTLPHKGTDSRGNRRYFSLASSPTEPNPMLLVKFYNPSSSYKKALLANDNLKLDAASLAGDFTLPEDPLKKLVFIAGGVGIAPFRSMVKYLVDSGQKRDVTLIFANRHKEDIMFIDLWKQAEAVGVKTVYVLTDKEHAPSGWQGRVGHLDEKAVQEIVPDYGTRIFYVSGPQLMVQNFEDVLKKTGVSGKNIITDFFPGYAER